MPDPVPAVLIPAPDMPAADQLPEGPGEEQVRAARAALPARFHIPIWDTAGRPSMWLCAVCWGDGWASQWPCSTAAEHGGDVFAGDWAAAAAAVAAAERERIAKLAEAVGATRTERCHDPAHAQMVHAIKALGFGGGHAVPFADLLRDEVAREAEVLHSEHHPGYIVPSLDSCTEHDRAAYERMVRDLRQDKP